MNIGEVARISFCLAVSDSGDLDTLRMSDIWICNISTIGFLHQIKSQKTIKEDYHNDRSSYFQALICFNTKRNESKAHAYQIKEIEN